MVHPLFVCAIEMFAQLEQTLKNFYCCPVKCVLLPMLLKFCIENKRANYSPPYFLRFARRRTPRQQSFLVFAHWQRLRRMRNGVERRGGT